MANTLTPAETESLQGRELDAAVAAWIGYTNIQHDCYTPVGKETCGTHPLGMGGFDGHGRVIIPHYSTSLSDAWCLVEGMRELGNHFVFGDVADGGWFAEFGECGPVANPDKRCRGESAPLVICRAALKAVSG